MMTESATPAADLRGKMRRTYRLMPDEEARAYLMRQHVAHVATVDESGWPYVTPLVYIYEGGDILYLHTGAEPGHFLKNLQHNPRICLEVSEMGPLHPGHRFACNSALVYTSVTVWGTIRIIDDREQKALFFDRLLEKYGDPSWQFEPGYPAIDKIILYELPIEVLTGKRSKGLSH
ncbi:pyridoxamine 5'-phosphate oxidase family protein [Nitrolancea hollandica]|nr:pyridoxamine 5'-phosphate oxidase family protein [Nitrolancea hollandica]